MSMENFAELRQIFNSLDSNNSGYISVRKLKKAMERMGFEVAKEDVLHIIDNMDSQQNGYISYSCFLAATVNLKERLSEKLLQETFSYFDNSGIGCITQNDLLLSLKSLGHVATDDEIQLMLREYRFAEPGKISYLEFKKMMIAEFTPKNTPHPLKDIEEDTPEGDTKITRRESFTSLSSKCQIEYNRRRRGDASEGNGIIIPM